MTEELVMDSSGHYETCLAAWNGWPPERPANWPCECKRLELEAAQLKLEIPT